jgi:hypothetical protein
VTIRASVFASLVLFAIPAIAGNEILWHDPGQVEALDLWWGPGGRENAPAPPYSFAKEDLSGTKPKVLIADRNGRKWDVKFGSEVRGECFGSRIMWAAGYFIEPAYFIPEGRIEGVKQVSKRVREVIGKDGSFRDARFQLRTPEFKFLDDRNWAWTNNPFLGTHELAGLKVLIMLVSNWDNKDARDVDVGINTAIFERRMEPRYVYTFTDWGESMGGWGYYANRKSWSCKLFTSETDNFVSVVDGEIRWGYVGRHASFKKGITPEDIRWLLQYIGQITDKQLSDSLRASGATREEAECFTSALRRRIDMLRTVSGLR